MLFKRYLILTKVEGIEYGNIIKMTRHNFQRLNLNNCMACKYCGGSCTRVVVWRLKDWDTLANICRFQYDMKYICKC